MFKNYSDLFQAENIGVVLDHLPGKSQYCAGGMMRKKRDEFNEWYKNNRKQPFDLRQSLFEYCSSDVRILVHGLIRMREIFREATGMDITKSITISVGFILREKKNVK